MIEIATAVVLTGVLAFYCFVQYRYSYWKRNGIPYLEPKFPFGNLKDLTLGRQFMGYAFKDIYDRLEDHKLGGIFHIFRPVLIVKDPDEVRNILTKEFDKFADRDFNLDRGKDFMAYTLFHNQDNREWKQMRSKLTRTLSSARLKQTLDEMVRWAEVMLEEISENADKESTDSRMVTSNYTTNISFSSFFGLTADNKDPFLLDVRDAVSLPRFTTLLREVLYLIEPWLPRIFRINLMPYAVRDFFDRLSSQTLEHRRNVQQQSRGDMFDQMVDFIRSRELETNSKWDGETNAMIAQCFLFYAASYDSTSFTMSACLRALAAHPEVKAKLVDEIERVLGTGDEKITYEAIQAMHYLDQVVSETLRIMPPVPELQRKCVKHYQSTTGLMIEPGVRVIIPVYAIHWDPNHYPEPEKFIPERFSQGNEHRRERYTYLPFGDGPRSCIGMRFGLLMAKVGLVSILRRYDFEADPRCKYPLDYSPKMFVVSVIKDPLWLKFKTRQQ